jgi:prepilin-type N-terminal cleavage/methylation domain-containing protein
MTHALVTSRRNAGFTLVELVVVLALSGVILAGILKLMTGQGRGYAQMIATGDAAETLRGAGALVGWEVRHAQMATDSIMQTNADTLSLRSVQGVGVVCAKNTLTRRYGIWKQGGDIQATVNDSTMIFNPGRQQWSKLKITGVGTPVSYGMLNCSWTGVRAPDLVVQVNVTQFRDTSGILIGSMFRSFRRTIFAEYQDQGRWWLGRKVGTAAWEKVTGPLLSPAQGGLKFAYYDSTGAAVAADSVNRIRTIGITMRAQSYKLFVGPTGGARYRIDSVSTRVMLRH